MNFFKRFLTQQKYKIFNKKNFKNLNKNKTSSILIEFNGFQPSHVCFSYFSQILSKKYKSKIVAFHNYSLISTPLKFGFKTKIKWMFGKMFGVKTFGIYKSFGTDEFIKPEFDNIKLKKNILSAQKILKKIDNREDLLNTNFDHIKVGDLIYDTYLKKFQKPTVDINDKNFINLFLDFYCLYIFWKNYFDTSEIKGVVGVHSCYSFGLVLRIAYKRSIPTFAVSTRWAFRLNEKMPYINGQYKNYKKTFKSLSEKLKKRGKKIADYKLQQRFKGSGGANVDMITSQNSSFKKVTFKSLINKNKRIKILIAPHDFFDAVHIFGNMFFNDFYDWLEFLGKISEKTNYDWYIKNRPNHPGKFQIYQPHTQKIIDKICSKYKNIKVLPNNYSHNQIISEGINFVLTCYGSVGVEYAYFKIPVINASLNNPHVAYNFNIQPKNKKDYIDIILNLKKYINFGRKISKEEIKEYYFMRHLYLDKNWIIQDLNKMLKYVGGYDNMWSHKFYNYYLENLTKQKHKQIIKNIQNFINSKNNYINISHTNKIL